MLDEVMSAIAQAEAEGRLASSRLVGLEGYSGAKLIGALQRLTQLSSPLGGCYLEIGVYRGLTLLSVAVACPETRCFGIDNYAQFDRDGENQGIVEASRVTLAADNARVINEDYEDAFAALPRTLGTQKIGVYFVDGPHDYRSQSMCLQLALPHLHDQAIIVIDDCNYAHVRQANRDFLVVNPQFKLVFDAYTRAHPNNMTGIEQEDARRGWWNGVNILLHDPSDEIEPIYPPTDRSRRAFEDDHLTHAARLAPQAPLALKALGSLDRLDLGRALVYFFRLQRSMIASRKQRRGRFLELNTDSETLTPIRYARRRQP